MTQELIAFVINEVNKVTSPGKKALQKIFYFLKEKDVPLDIKFGIHLYGPYSSNLDYTLQTFEMDGIVKYERVGSSLLIKPGEEMEYYIKESQIKSEAEQWKEQIQYVLTHIGQLSPKKLELLSTTHFLAKQRLKDESKLNQIALVEDVIKLKKDKFSKSDIEESIDQLKQLSYLE